jgi:uncharacterized damage-inducible protein DinB
MEDQRSRLLDAVKGISSRELEWQAAPGMNSIGMLLAHLAIGEALWTQRALLGLTEADLKPAIGLSREDDGIPLAVDGRPPGGLDDKTLADYEGHLSRARACLREAATPLTDADMDRGIALTRRGATYTMNIRWVLYHLLEHFAGHFGQILLLRHLYRARAEGNR